MKTERRHELHHNALADWIGDHIERVRPYARIVLGTVLVVAVASVLYAYMTVQSSRHSEEGWQQYFQALDTLNAGGDAEKLTQIADAPAAARAPVGYWAKLSLGDYFLSRGIEELFSDRLTARRSLETSLDYYGQVARQSHQPMLADRATLGMGCAYESLNELDLARSKYRLLAAATGPFAAEAQQRLSDLDREQTKKFYDWFSAAKLPRTKFEGFGLPGDRPSFGTFPDEQQFNAADADGDKLLGKSLFGGDKAPAGDATGPADAADGTSIDFPSDSSSADEPAPSGDATPPTDAPPADAPKSDQP